MMCFMKWRESDTGNEDWGLPELAGWKGEPDQEEADELAELVDGCFVEVDGPDWRVSVDRVRDLLIASLAEDAPLVEIPAEKPQLVAFQPHPDDPVPETPKPGKPRLSIEKLEDHR